VLSSLCVSLAGHAGDAGHHDSGPGDDRGRLWPGVLDRGQRPAKVLAAGGCGPAREDAGADRLCRRPAQGSVSLEKRADVRVQRPDLVVAILGHPVARMAQRTARPAPDLAVMAKRKPPRKAMLDRKESTAATAKLIASCQLPFANCSSAREHPRHPR